MTASWRVVAIDGPAASGKSSVARELAKALGFAYVNSGAMYRAFTWHVLAHTIDPNDAAAIARLAEETKFQCDVDEKEAHMMIDGADPSTHLREVQVNQAVSQVSSVPRVRELLVERMRAYARERDIVMEGRDIGSVVFPRTPHKFYIDASPAIRSQRRAAQGQTDHIAARDHADSSRLDSPLTMAEDAHLIDSSHLSIKAVVREIIERLEAQGLHAPAPGQAAR